MTGLLQRVEENIQSRRLLRRRQTVLVAVSGGLDSTVLLHLLRELSRRYRWALTVAHFNHQLRGRSSDADERFVRQMAAALELPFVAGRANVRDFARNSKLSIEMAARKLRHQFLVHAAKREKIRVVALAHQADDQVELFFLRLLRGAGGEGLAGMKWGSPSPMDAGISLVRPLLDVSKEELRRYAEANKIRFREDATNALCDLPRNRVRNELLPRLRRRHQPALTKTVLRLMEIAGAESEFIGETARQWLRGGGLESASRQSHRGKPGQLAATAREAAFDGLPVALQRRVVQLQLAALGVPADFDLVERLRRAADVRISVAPDFYVQRDAAGRVELQTKSAAPFNAREVVCKLAGRAGGAMFDGVRLDWRFQARTRKTLLRRRKGCEFFDADRVGGKVILRHWRPGDRFQPIGMKSPVKLQDLFTNLKIPRARRRALTVASAASGEIFWVEGLRVSENFKLTPETKQCLVWRWRHP